MFDTLSRDSRGAATLSTALNSNAINVAQGCLSRRRSLGSGAGSGQTTLITVWYAGFTAVVLGLAIAGRGLQRTTGVLIIAGYAAFVVAVALSS
jgi:hypothetical protein